MAAPRARLQGAGAGLAGPPFTLFYLSLADSALPVRVVNTRILVAGSSPTALAVTEHLATRYSSLYYVIHFFALHIFTNFSPPGGSTASPTYCNSPRLVMS